MISFVIWVRNGGFTHQTKVERVQRCRNIEKMFPKGKIISHQKRTKKGVPILFLMCCYVGVPEQILWENFRPFLRCFVPLVLFFSVFSPWYTSHQGLQSWLLFWRRSVRFNGCYFLSFSICNCHHSLPLGNDHQYTRVHSSWTNATIDAQAGTAVCMPKSWRMTSAVPNHQYSQPTTTMRMRKKKRKKKTWKIHGMPSSKNQLQARQDRSSCEILIWIRIVISIWFLPNERKGTPPPFSIQSAHILLTDSTNTPLPTSILLRFYDPKLVGVSKEKCLLIAVDTKLEERRSLTKAGQGLPIFSLKESLSELSELVGTAGLQVSEDSYENETTLISMISHMAIWQYDRKRAHIWLKLSLLSWATSKC